MSILLIVIVCVVASISLYVGFLIALGIFHGFKDALALRAAEAYFQQQRDQWIQQANPSETEISEIDEQIAAQLEQVRMWQLAMRGIK